MVPLVSVVIPTYNRGNCLSRALESLQSQTYTHWEAVIVDNHSVDNTDEIVAKFNDSRIKLLKIHNNGVVATSRNMGISNAEGEYVAFLDSDDWWSPQKLNISMRYLQCGHDIVYHDLYLVSSAKQKLFLKKIKTFELIAPVFDNLLLNGNALSNSSVVVRKDLLNSIGGLSEEKELIGAEDYDAWLKISMITEKFKKIPETLGYYWAGGGNITNSLLSLKIADAVERRYWFENRNRFDVKSLSWLDYYRGRAYFKQKYYELAGESLNKIKLNNSSTLVVIKTKWMLLRIAIQRFCIL